MELSGDSIVLWRHGMVVLNSTIAYTWVLMLAMILGSWLITRRLSRGARISRFQAVLEIVVIGMRRQIAGAGLDNPDRYIGFIGTLFLFIGLSTLLTIVPGWKPPTGSLSTTTALALAVFVAVPIYGVAERGIWGYLKEYAQPTPLMLPFNIIGDLSRTLALAVRLFGNIMSDTMIIGILLAIAPLVFPILMHVLGLLTGMVQAYIFAILATVYIAAATRTRRRKGAAEGE